MRYKRLYATPDGESHFEDIEVPMDEQRSKLFRSQAMKVVSMTFRQMDVGFESPWHVNPGRYFSTHLEGDYELEASDGTVFRPRPGDVYLVEDLMGKGHYGRNVGKTPVRSLVVAVE